MVRRMVRRPDGRGWRRDDGRSWRCTDDACWCGATATAAAGGEATAAGAATTEAGGAMEGALSMEEELRAAASCPRAPTTASEENITLIAAEKIVGFQILEQTYYLVRGKFVPEADADFDYDDKASNPTTEHWMTKADFIDKIEAGHQFEEQRWS